MTYQALNQPGLRNETRAMLAVPAGRMADVIELIMADHRRIRRLGEALQDAAHRSGYAGPEWVTEVWQRLTGVLEPHFQAEEEICYLPMFKACPHIGGGRADAIADHGDIREAITEASLRSVGSVRWWRAVRAALTACTEHLDREETGILAECLPRLTRSQRQVLGRQWLAFIAAYAQDSGSEAPWRTSRTSTGSASWH